MKNEEFEKDAFGNLSSTRKLRRQVIYFTLFLISIMVVPLCVRIAVDGITGMKIDYSILFFLLSIIVILFTAGLVPAAFAQSKEWMAFIQKGKT